MADPVPELVRGVWRRHWIRFADGQIDDSTVVYWMQMASTMVDVRFSATQSRAAAQPSFLDCSLDDLRVLATNDSSSGFTTCTPIERGPKGASRVATATWTNGGAGAVAFQPVSSFPEPGLLEWGEDNDVMHERAPSGDYVEEWHRVSAAGTVTHERLADGSQLFSSSDHAILVRDRAIPLSDNTPLTTLVGAADQDRAALTDLVNCEFSLAERRASTWQVVESTLPGRIGQTLR